MYAEQLFAAASLLALPCALLGQRVAAGVPVPLCPAGTQPKPSSARAEPCMAQPPELCHRAPSRAPSPTAPHAGDGTGHGAEGEL